VERTSIYLLLPGEAVDLTRVDVKPESMDMGAAVSERVQYAKLRIYSYYKDKPYTCKWFCKFFYKRAKQ
jgi:hypothetical protein